MLFDWESKSRQTRVMSRHRRRGNSGEDGGEQKPKPQFSHCAEEKWSIEEYRVIFGEFTAGGYSVSKRFRSSRMLCWEIWLSGEALSRLTRVARFFPLSNCAPWTIPKPLAAPLVVCKLKSFPSPFHKYSCSTVFRFIQVT